MDLAEDGGSPGKKRGLKSVNIAANFQGTSEEEASEDITNSPMEDSYAQMEEGGSIDASVLGQVSNGTQGEGSLDDHAKQLLHHSLEQLHVESPRDLPVKELGKLEGQVQGLILGALAVMKDGMPVAEELGNQDHAAEWFADALSNLPSDLDPLETNNVARSISGACIDRHFKGLQETSDEFLRGARGSISDPSISYDGRLIFKKPSKYAAPTAFVENAVTVKFHLSDGEIYTKAYKIHFNIKEVRENLAEELHFPASMINVYKDNVKLDDWLPLAGLGVEPYGTLELVLESVDPIRYPITCQSSKSFVSDTSNVEVPDVINVTVEVDDNNYKELVVEIWNQAMDKPWIGGYRDKRSFREFHHAFTQTQPVFKPCQFEVTYNQDTQTVPVRNRTQNTPSDKTTQSVTRDVYIPTVNDKIITPQKYVTHAEMEKKRDLLHKVITIQRYTRGWMARKKVRLMREEYNAQLSWEEGQEKKREKETTREIKKHATRQVYPQTRADFEMLYNLVERWRLAEIRRISELKTEAPKKAELCYLLEKEIVLLNSIEKHRIRLKKEKLQKKEIDFIEKSAKPIEWTGKAGQMISMDTVRTQRARELKELYMSLCRQNLSVQGRVNLLISLKHALKTYQASSRVVEITLLMERECDCLIRGLHNKDMQYLRKRIKNMFLELMKDPKFNPEVAKYLPEFTASPELSKYIKCEKCGIMFPLTKFVKTTMSKRLAVCVSCKWLENIACNRIELGPYQHIVRALRRDEQKRCCFTSVAFIMQDEDFYFLINKIWHSHSILSECNDMFRLRLGRWIDCEDWSPWNCVLLTSEELRSHINLPDIYAFYESLFIHDVKLKHYQARNHFKHLEKMDIKFQRSGDWFAVDPNIHYEPPSSEADEF